MTARVGETMGMKKTDVQKENACPTGYNMEDECTSWIEETDIMAFDGSCNKGDLYTKTLEGFQKYNGAERPELMWRMGRAAYLLSTALESQKNKVGQKKCLLEAEDYLRKAVGLLPEDPEARAWLCFTLGKLCGFLSIKQRAKMGKELHDNLVIAIELRPDNYYVHHVFGRWCIEVAALSWLERKTASVIFGAKLKATYDDALKYLFKVNELCPNWKTNYGYIARAYIGQSNYKEAMKWIESGLQLPSTSDEDVVVHELLLTLEKKYAKYK